MKRRNFIKGLVGLAAIPALSSVEAGNFINVAPETSEELFHAINDLCKFGGWSMKAYEEIDGIRYTHKCYEVASDNGDETKMVKVLWKTAQFLVENNGSDRPVIIWRMKPDIRYEDGKSKLWMRFSIGPDGSDHYSSIYEKKEGMPVVYI